MNCISNASITIPMEPPDAGWDYKVFKTMALAGWDTSSRRLDWATQLQMPSSWGRRGLILNGIPCVGQAYPQRPSLNETLPSCDRQKWWIVFDSASQCSGYCKDSTWADTNANGTKDKLIKTVAVQCGWIDDQTFAMMGNKWIYSTGGCKTIGLIIKTGDCYDTFWYNKYKYIADLQAGFDILDPASYNTNTGKYTNTLDYASYQYLRLCPPFQAILTVADTQQAGITDFTFSITKNFGAPWTKSWYAPIENKCKWVQGVSYLLCSADSFTIDPFSGDTTYNNCFIFPNPANNCGVNQSGNYTLQYFLNHGYIKKTTYKLLDLRDTLFLNDAQGNSLLEPGKYAINSVVTNIYGCVNMAQSEVFAGHYTDFEASNQVICNQTGSNTVTFKGNIKYFNQKLYPWDPELNPTEFWRDPKTARGGYLPVSPYVPEKVEWDLNGDGIYGDGATGVPDSVSYVYTQPGNYTVRMRTTDSNNCVQILERKNYIQVVGAVADFGLAQSVSVCAPQPVKFLDKSYGLNIYQYDYDIYGNKIDSTAIDSVISWKWDFGDHLSSDRSKSRLKNPVHVYLNNGCFDVTLIIEMVSGCKDTIVKKNYFCIQGPIPKFKILDSVGYEPFTVFVKDASLHLATWEFIKGDNTTASYKSRPADSIFALVYNTPGQYYLYLRASDSVYNSAVGKWLNCTATYGEPSDSSQPHFKIVVYPTSIEEAVKSDEFFVYPNPFTGSVNVYIPQNKAISEIALLDLSGKTILFRKNIRVNNVEIFRDELPQGIYILKIVSDKVYVFKLMAE